MRQKGKAAHRAAGVQGMQGKILSSGSWFLQNSDHRITNLYEILFAVHYRMDDGTFCL